MKKSATSTSAGTILKRKTAWLERLSRKGDATPEQLRVGMYLIAKLNFKKHTAMAQSQIAKDLGLKQPNVCRALGNLKKMISRTTDGRNHAYMLRRGE